ncbi:MAG: type II restriction endonuclease [Kiritimatiellae bacterium]|nr:type II restriction endonuclease [Kiritimatiellia bacterium]
MKSDALFSELRGKFHRKLINAGILSLDADGVASNADRSNVPSRMIAQIVATRLGAATATKQKGQSSGARFEEVVREFVEASFPLLQHLRPGSWSVLRLGNQSKVKTADFAQYEHLYRLQKAVEKNPDLAAALGNDYLVSPDVVVVRALYEDAEINAPRTFVSDDVCLKADLRKRNGGRPILHASISAKWTMRSDRSQNSRTEALNLIRDRKGRLPHVVVVTGEPLPSRLASLALGTGDIDCVYHFALYELIDAVREYGKEGREDIIEQLESMVEGKRLKDISDLPLDLSC